MPVFLSFELLLYTYFGNNTTNETEKNQKSCLVLAIVSIKIVQVGKNDQCIHNLHYFKIFFLPLYHTLRKHLLGKQLLSFKLLSSYFSAPFSLIQSVSYSVEKCVIVFCSIKNHHGTLRFFNNPLFRHASIQSTLSNQFCMFTMLV